MDTKTAKKRKRRDAILEKKLQNGGRENARSDFFMVLKIAAQPLKP